MADEANRRVIDGDMLKALLHAGAMWLARHQQRVNHMNVFPVPDGDTGTNMVTTMNRAYKRIKDLQEPEVGALSLAFAKAARRESRGNSGTILSMLLQGFANSLQDETQMDAAALARACRGSIDYAYNTVQKVMEPVEGTILTVAREAMQAVEDAAANEDDLRILLDTLLTQAQDTLRRTPEMLPTLKEAGVVDSGGLGLVYMFEGMQRWLDGKSLGEAVTQEMEAIQTATQISLTIDPDEHYDVQFIMIGDALDVDAVRRDIMAMGKSPLVDGDTQEIKVHIHVTDPSEPLRYAYNLGVELDEIVVENLHLQTQAYNEMRNSDDEPQAVEGIAVITVARGAGFRQVFKSYNAAYVVEGGQTMNPSTGDFLQAIERLPNDEIILLPNNKNILMAAYQAVEEMPDKRVRVVASRTIPQGIAALLGYLDAGDAALDEVVGQMETRMKAVHTIEITTATLARHINDLDVLEGDLIAIVDGEMIAAESEMGQVIHAALVAADAQEAELITLYYGADVGDNEAQTLVEALRDDFTEQEFEAIAGGQPLYPYIISIE